MATFRGRSIPRLEDKALVRGLGRFVEDISIDDCLYAYMLRSTAAHARLIAIDVSTALDMPGVIGVVTSRDIPDVGKIGAIRREGMGETTVPEHPVLADSKVFYVGQPIAFVIAETRATARDALESIHVTYEPLGTVLKPSESVDPTVPILHPEIGTNVVMHAKAGSGDVDTAFATAEHLIKGSYEVPRLVASPMECRGVVARFDDDHDELTIWSSTQVPHRVKTYLGSILPNPPKNIRVIAPDVGGGFGRKIEVWPEEILCAHMSIKLGRPIKWLEERSENMRASHGRGFSATVEAAVNSAGVIAGMRIRMSADMGAFFMTSSGGPLGNAVQRVAGPYAIPAMDVECVGVLSNRPPTGPYRGAGGPEAAVPVERMMDDIASKLQIDPAEIRRRNFVSRDDFPYNTATGLLYDSGDFQGAFERLMDIVGYDDARERQLMSPDSNHLVGIGLATVVKASGGKANVRTGNARLQLLHDGRISVCTDVSPHGQGTETTFAQFVADVLGVRPADVDVRHGDTDQLESGGGTTSSRGLAVGGSAAFLGAEQLRDQLATLAAPLLGCDSSEEIELKGGFAGRRDSSDQRIGLDALAQALTEDQATIETSYTLPSNPFAFAAHAAIVGVDTETGDVKIERFAAVHDCGLMINPMIVEGQIHGGIAQGIGQALSEVVRYDEAGQPSATSFMSYGLPTAEDIPFMELDNLQTPSPTNPLGIKGIGETPTVASPVAVANAVIDALRARGIDHIDIPLDRDKIWRAINIQGG